MNARFTRLRAGMLLLAGAMLVSACATGPEIRHDISPTANFAAYRTFGFLAPLSTDKAGYETVLSTRLKSATRRAMEDKGYRYTDSNPDLLLNFYASMQERQEIHSTSVGIGYWDYHYGLYGGFPGPEVYTHYYKQGTLIIDVVDARQKMLVWQSVAEGRVSDEDRNNPGPAIDRSVAVMMQPLPLASRM
jgi:hypothetical protein